MKVTINGTEYPIAYTVEAQNQVAERAGGLDKIKDCIGGERLPHMAVLHIMMEAAERRNKVLARMNGEEYSGPAIPDEGDMKEIVLIGEMRGIMEAISAAMREGNRSEVELAPEPQKTGKKTEAIP